MKKNMGINDRILRLIIAAFFIVLYMQSVVTGIWGIVLLVLAGVFVLTSFLGFCPLYTLFRINTFRNK